RICGRTNFAYGWLPARAVMSSRRPTLTAATWTSTSPGPGCGVGTDTGVSTSGGPNSANTTAVIIAAGAAGLGHAGTAPPAAVFIAVPRGCAAGRSPGPGPPPGRGV